MMQLTFTLQKAAQQKNLSDKMVMQQRLDLGTARAADVITGALRAASLRDPLHGRTGNLARSWRTERIALFEFRAVNSLPYSRILEKGSVVTPKNAKMLAIPIGEGVTEGGVARFTSPRAVEGLFVFRSKAGNLLMAKKTGSHSMDLYFALKEKVTIPAFRYASKAISGAKQAALQQIKNALKGNG